MIFRDIRSAIATVLLSIMAILPAMADDCYINDAGHVIIIRDNGEGRAQAIFDFEQDSFIAEGPHLTSIVLTQYVGKDKERFAHHKNGPETAIEFSRNLAKVKTSKSSPWNLSVIKGDYHRLDLSFITEKLRNNGQFLEAEKQMETALQSLLDATPKEQQHNVKLAQETWKTEIAEKMALDVLLDSNLLEGVLEGDSSRIIKAIPDAYIDVVSLRTRWLEILTKQQQNPQYMPTFKGTIYRMDRGGEGINIMLRPDNQYSNLYLCSSETSACSQAEKILAEKETATVQVTGKLDFVKGFIQEDQGITVKTINQPAIATVRSKS